MTTPRHKLILSLVDDVTAGPKPTIPFEKQTLGELLVERGYWERRTDASHSEWLIAKAIRDACEFWINKRQQEGEAA